MSQEMFIPLKKATPADEKILEAGTLEQVKELSKNKMQFVNDLSPLHFAAANKDIKIMRYLIDEKNMNPNAVTKDNLTPLHSAAFRGNLEVIRLLIEEYDANHMLKDDRGLDLMGVLKYGESGKYRCLVPVVKTIIENAAHKKAAKVSPLLTAPDHVLRQRGFFSTPASSEREKELLVETDSSNAITKKTEACTLF